MHQLTMRIVLHCQLMHDDLSATRSLSLCFSPSPLLSKLLFSFLKTKLKRLRGSYRLTELQGVLVGDARRLVSSVQETVGPLGGCA